jgi:hypothetical protein
LTGQNLVCPHCDREFFATPPDPGTQIILPEKLPFFKAGRKRLLEQKMDELIGDGEMSKVDEDTLKRMAAMLDLKVSDMEDVVKDRFLEEFNLIKKRVARTWHLTDEDLLEIESLKRKYGVQLKLEDEVGLCRRIYLLEVKGERPQPIVTSLDLGRGEEAYFSISTIWHQTRSRTRSYSGASFSIPTGIKGVRFRFGQYVPNRVEEITPLSSGTLYVTSKRVLFDGEHRNCNFPFEKILRVGVYTDCVKIEKATGKDDYFTMDLRSARYIAALVTGLKKGG